MFLVNKLCNSLIYNFCNKRFCRKSKIHKFLKHIKLFDIHTRIHTCSLSHTHTQIFEGVVIVLLLKQVCVQFCLKPLLKKPSPVIQSMCRMVPCSHTKHAQTDGAIPFSTVLYRGRWSNGYF